jgi:4-amino-4-deoxy-L-arabinose transferase-like glycosyltransferase
MNARNTLLFLLLITLLGGALRFQAVTATVVDHPIRADARIYYLAALNLDRWKVFSRSEPGNSPPKPDAFVQPALPWVLTHFIEFPPTDRMLLRFNITQAVLGTLTILLTFGFFRILAGPAVALGAALITALSPHLVVMSTYLLTETLFTFLLMGGIFGLALGLQRHQTIWAVIGGVLLGMSALTRATTEYLPLLMLPFLYWATDSRTFRHIALPATLAAFAVIAAWKLRNLGATGALGDPTLMISALHHGMYPDFMFNGIPESLGAPYRFDPFTQQINGAASVLAEIFHRATKSPADYFWWYVIGKPISLLSWEMIDGIGDIFIYPISASPYLDRPLFSITRTIVLWLHAPLSIAAVIGTGIAMIRPSILGISVAKSVTARLVAMVVLYFFAIHFIGAPFPRYGVPLRPLIYGFGLFTLVSLACQMYSGRIQQTT